MDNKTIAIILVAVIAIAGVAAYFVFLKPAPVEDDSGTSIVGRVNSEGSGIFLVPGEDAADYITVQTTEPGDGAKFVYNEITGKYYVFNTSNWGGKVFGTPGAATIQHVQLKSLVDLMGLKYVSYMKDQALESDTVYYLAGVTGLADFMNKMETTPFTGYFTWEAQYSAALAYEGQEFVPLVTTNDLFPEHTCCIIGTSNEFAVNNADAMSAFLYVYSKAVDEINVALEDTTSDDYKTLLEVALDKVAMPEALSEAEKRTAIENALKNVTYLYADDENGSLDKLVDDISEVAESLYNGGQISNSAQDLGFKSYDALAEKFVQSSYMTNAIKGSYTKLTSTVNINVSVIGGDIHQIALWYALEKGMFAEENITITTMVQGNGPAVFTLIYNGEADIGFLGAPPMTINSMNHETIVA